MALFKCKMCGGELELQADSNVAECLYCGSKQTVPHIESEKKLRLYNRAIQYRLDNEFEKAYNAYESIISEKEDESEAYWGLVLSEYGVEYVEDPATGKRIPTCHRTLVKSVMSNENYKLACKYADSESRMMYEDEAEELDALQKKILTAASKEEPYDIFICYKETNQNGERTADSVLAQEIYDELTKRDFRVFFARITLEDKLGKDYEPCIYSALTSAKVMLMVTTDSEHCNAVWVKNEWKRYIDFMKNDSEKVLIPVYRDISPYALPDEFAKLQAQDMSKLGAVQDLVRGVEKILGKNRSGVQGGLGAHEKELLEKIEKKERRKSILIKTAVIGALSFFAFAFVLGSMEKLPLFYVKGMQISLHNIGLKISLFFASFAVAIVTIIAVLISWIKGLKSKVAHKLYLVAFVGFGLFLIGNALKQTYPSKYVLIVYLLLGALTAISTMVSYRKAKKKLLGYEACVAVLAVIPLIFAGTSPGQSNKRDDSVTQIEIKNSTLNVRAEADENSTRLTVVNKGEIYTVLEVVETEKYTWYKINTNYDISGYVASGTKHEYVEVLKTEFSQEQSNARDESMNQIEILAGSLSLYDCTLETRQILGKVYQGEVYTVSDVSVGNSKIWYEITTGLGVKGYVSRDMLEETPSIKEYVTDKVSFVSDKRDESLWQISVIDEYRNVREKPSSSNSSEKIGRVFRNEIYTVHGIEDVNGMIWIRIALDEEVFGYVSAGSKHEYFEYLPANGSVQSNEIDASKEQFIVSNKQYLYESPNKDSDIIAILFESEVYDILNTIEDEYGIAEWYEVQTTNGISGYVNR